MSNAGIHEWKISFSRSKPLITCWGRQRFNTTRHPFQTWIRSTFVLWIKKWFSSTETRTDWTTCHFCRAKKRHKKAVVIFLTFICLSRASRDVPSMAAVFLSYENWFLRPLQSCHICKLFRLFGCVGYLTLHCCSLLEHKNSRKMSFNYSESLSSWKISLHCICLQCMQLHANINYSVQVVASARFALSIISAFLQTSYWHMRNVIL